MRFHLKKQFKDLKSIAPSERWLAAHRDLLLSQVRAQNSSDKMFKVSRREQAREAFVVLEAVFSSSLSAIFARGLAFTALTFVLLLASGGYIVTAAEGAVPGERLYGLKISVENARLKMAGSPKAKVELQTEFASRRLEELAKLTANDGARLPEAETLVSQFETSLKDISAAASQISSTSPDKAMEIAIIVDNKVGEYESALKSAGGASQSANLSKSVSRALSTVNKAGTEALKVLVGQGTPSEPEKIAGKLNDKIKNVEEKLRLADAKLSASSEGGEGGAKVTATSSAKDVSADAKTNLEEAKKKITEGDYQAALNILDKVEDMVEEVADSAEAVVEDQPEAGPPGAGNTESGTQNTEGEVKGESTIEQELTPDSSTTELKPQQ